MIVDLGIVKLLPSLLNAFLLTFIVISHDFNYNSCCFLDSSVRGKVLLSQLINYS